MTLLLGNPDKSEIYLAPYPPVGESPFDLNALKKGKQALFGANGNKKYVAHSFQYQTHFVLILSRPSSKANAKESPMTVHNITKCS